LFLFLLIITILFATTIIDPFDLDGKSYA